MEQETAIRRRIRPIPVWCLHPGIYASAKTKTRTVSSLAEGGIDYATILEQKSVNGGAYKTISKTDFTYDAHGNERPRGKSTLPTVPMEKRKSSETIMLTTVWDSRRRRP